MSADAHGAMRSMIQIYATLHPQHCHSRKVSWEMDLDTLEALLTWRLPVSHAEVLLRLPGGEVECLGIRVAVVERPGVRLVIEAVAA